MWIATKGGGRWFAPFAMLTLTPLFEIGRLFTAVQILPFSQKSRLRFISHWEHSALFHSFQPQSNCMNQKFMQFFLFESFGVQISIVSNL